MACSIGAFRAPKNASTAIDVNFSSGAREKAASKKYHVHQTRTASAEIYWPAPSPAAVAA
jgi:hypothetical protein